MGVRAAGAHDFAGGEEFCSTGFQPVQNRGPVARASSPVVETHFSPGTQAPAWGPKSQVSVYTEAGASEPGAKSVAHGGFQPVNKHSQDGCATCRMAVLLGQQLGEVPIPPLSSPVTGRGAGGEGPAYRPSRLARNQFAHTRTAMYPAYAVCPVWAGKSRGESRSLCPGGILTASGADAILRAQTASACPAWFGR